jgi:hypothetical protein
MFDLLFTYTTVATIAGDSPLSAARLAGIGRHGVVGLPGRTTGAVIVDIQAVGHLDARGRSTWQPVQVTRLMAAA